MYFMQLLWFMMRKVRPSDKAVEKSLRLLKPYKNSCKMEDGNFDNDARKIIAAYSRNTWESSADT